MWFINTQICLHKLSQWSRRKFKRGEASQTSSASSTNLFISVLDVNKSKPLRKLTPFHHYFKLHYNSWIKAEYLCRFQLAKNEYNAATEEERAVKKWTALVAIALGCEVGWEFWLLEFTAFREEVTASTEEQHAKDMAEWEVLQQVPKTPQEFHQ